MKGNPIKSINEITNIIKRGLPRKRDVLMFSKEGGRIVKRICDPSRGGTGIKLNVPKIILIQTK